MREFDRKGYKKLNPIEKVDPNARLSIKERLAYGLGDYNNNLVVSSINAFLLVYYVSVLGVDSKLAASVLAVSKIFDGISDLIMGRIVDKTHSKWGKARPWILRMCVPLGISTVLMFSVPAGLTGTFQLTYMFLTYNLVSTVFYTAVSLPYSTLQGLMTTNQYERGLLGNFRMMLATFGTMTVNTVVLKMCAFFGGGEQYSQKGWTMAYICLMIVFVCLEMVTFMFCKERVVEEEVTEADTKADGPSVMECLKSLVMNRYWLIMVVFLFAQYFMMSCFFGSNLYFATYIMKNEDSYALISNALSISQMAMMCVTPFMMKKIGKRWTALIGMIAAGIAFTLTGFAGDSVTMVVACNVLKGMGFGCAAATVFGLLQDSITYGQWHTGVQAIGMGNAASSFSMKIGSGIGTAAMGWILDAGNFNVDPSGSAAATAIMVTCVWVPVITCVVAAVCMLVFDLDKHYEKAVDDLAKGRWRGSN